MPNTAGSKSSRTTVSIALGAGVQWTQWLSTGYAGQGRQHAGQALAKSLLGMRSDRSDFIRVCPMNPSEWRDKFACAPPWASLPVWRSSPARYRSLGSRNPRLGESGVTTDAKSIPRPVPTSSGACQRESNTVSGSVVDGLLSLDHLVGTQQERLRDRQPQRFGRLQVDDQFEARRASWDGIHFRNSIVQG
jgi:hypothetical protein